jgi:hypothetical protein
MGQSLHVFNCTQARQERRRQEYASMVERAEVELDGLFAANIDSHNVLGLLLQLQTSFPQELPVPDVIRKAATQGAGQLQRLLKSARNKFHPDVFRQEVSERKARAEVVFKIIGDSLGPA